MVGSSACQRPRRASAAPTVRTGGDQTAVGGPVQLARAVCAAGHGRRGAGGSDGLAGMAGSISLVAPGPADRSDDRRRQYQARRARPGPDPGSRGMEGPRRRRARHRRPCPRARPSGRPDAQADRPDGGTATGLPRYMGILRGQDLRLPTGRERFPAPGGPSAGHGDRRRTIKPSCTPVSTSRYCVLRHETERPGSTRPAPGLAGPRHRCFVTDGESSNLARHTISAVRYAVDKQILDARQRTEGVIRATTHLATRLIRPTLPMWWLSWHSASGVLPLYGLAPVLIRDSP